MYEVFSRHRWLKIGGLTLGLLILSYLIGAALGLCQSRAVPVDSLVGYYRYSSGYEVQIFNGNKGLMISDSAATDFQFVYSAGTLACSSPSLPSPWRMKVVNKKDLYNEYDGFYLYRLEVTQ